MNANKVDFGNGLVFVGCHITLTNFTTNASATEVKIENLPPMSTVVSCGVDAMQIGQATSYASYEHFYPTAYGADFYIRNTTASTTAAVEVNFHTFGVLSTS